MNGPLQDPYGRGLQELALFAGAGGGILGGQLLGWRTRAAVELDQYARGILLQRQCDGVLDPFPVWPGIETFDGLHWKGLIDVVSGGFPCTDISSAGKKAGIEGENSGLWSHMHRIIREVEPPLVFIENSPDIAKRGLEVVLQDLADLGFDAEWGVLSAAQIGAPHKRRRMWVVAANPNNRWERALPDDAALARSPEHVETFGEGWWEPGPFIPRVDAGVTHRMDRLRASGNCQVPAVAAQAFTILRRRLSDVLPVVEPE